MITQPFLGDILHLAYSFSDNFNNSAFYQQ